MLRITISQDFLTGIIKKNLVVKKVKLSSIPELTAERGGAEFLEEAGVHVEEYEADFFYVDEKEMYEDFHEKSEARSFNKMDFACYPEKTKLGLNYNNRRYLRSVDEKNFDFFFLITSKTSSPVIKLLEET